MNTLKQTFLSWGITAKLVALFLVFGVIPMTAVGMIAFNAASSMKESAGLRFQTTAEELANKIDRNLFERYGDVQAFGYNDALNRVSQWYDPTPYGTISQVMNKYVKAYGIYDLTILVDTKGDVIAVNFENAQGQPIDSQFLFEKNFAESPWFQALSQGQFTTIQPFTAPGNDISSGTFIEYAHIDSDVIQATGGDGYIMGFSAPVYNETGEVMAYWSNRMNMNVIEQMFQEAYGSMKASRYPGTELTLLDSHGRVLVDMDPLRLGTEDIVRNFEVLLNLNLAEKGVVAAEKAIAGDTGFINSFHTRKQITQVGGYTHLKGALGFPGMNWAVLVRVPEEEAMAQAEAIQQKVIMTSLICLALIIPVGWYVGRSSARNIIQVGEVAQKAAEGELSYRVTLKRNDELGQLGSAFNTMMESLTEVVSEVRQAAEHVSTASTEITQGNEDLSQRTSQQASALEETSASMEEMTSTIKQNADNAKQANQLAIAAREVAEKGGSVTLNAVQAMDEINKSSKKIADIINVIDDIAFQTNLLALNAAVEAARAGEQGRGFAVVASEVRNLAGRSATAAKEIKTLINESVQKVSDGSDLVNRSGQTLEEIVSSVKRVTDIISEISAASQEQAAGIDQVNKAVVEMDRATQQNAALVEEAAASSQSMSDQAQKLQKQVAFFKLDQPGNPSGGSLASSVSMQPQGKGSASPSSLSPVQVQHDFSRTSTQQGKSASKGTPVGIASENGHDRRKREDDFFEEF